MESIVIDRKQIIEEVKKDIRARNLVDDAKDFEKIDNIGYTYKFNRKMFYECIQSMDANKTDLWYFDLEGNKAKVFVQKIVRKLNAFMLTRAFNNQNGFNAQNVAALQEVAGYINECEERIAALEKEIEELKKGGK